MDEQSLRHILGRLGIRNVPRPNARGWLHVSCPFARWTHKNRVDRSQGFAIKVEIDGPSAYNCPVCKQHGRISHLARSLMRYHGNDYTQVAVDADMADLQGLANVPAFEAAPAHTVPVPLEEAIFDGLFEDPWAYPNARAFLESRGVSEKTVRKLELGFDPDKKRITFPVRGFQGELYGWSGRTILKNHNPKVLDYQDLPKRALILGVHLWKPGRPVAIIEGLFAYAHFHEIGADDTHNVGALLGSFLTPEKAAMLQGFDEPVYWFTDPDPAGDDCLFGRLLPVQPGAQKDGAGDGDDEGEPPAPERDTTTSALYMLNGHVPQYVPNYPVDDPDDLTREQFDWMVKTAELWLPATPVG